MGIAIFLIFIIRNKNKKKLAPAFGRSASSIGRLPALAPASPGREGVATSPWEGGEVTTPFLFIFNTKEK
jgi:hypothetical protein